MSIVAHTIVRNGADVIRQCLKAALPYVDRALVLVDSRSNDGTKNIVFELERQHSNLFVEQVEIKTPQVDLVEARNAMLKASDEDWIWILDSDEYYPKETIDEILYHLPDPD